jgi:formylglycine-generating enzyme required for sulfatase activity
MKKLTILYLCCFYMIAAPATAAVLGDINGDQKVDLAEAIYALQIVSGQTPVPTDAGDTDPNCTEAEIPGSLPGSYVNSLGMNFNLIPAGVFMMGSPEDEAGRDLDEILHEVTLSQPFYLMTTEVTQGQWQAVMGSNPSRYQGCGADCPVEMVSWNDIQEFITTLNRITCQEYRLPTEAEWEYAARAGSATALANGGLTADPWLCDIDQNLDAIGWYCANSAVTYNGCYDTSEWGGPVCSGPLPVGLKQPNQWGLYDMHGNVWEWVQDWYGAYSATPVTDPVGPASGMDHVLRGGGWDFSPASTRSANRGWDSADFRYDDIGFRLILIHTQ